MRDVRSIIEGALLGTLVGACSAPIPETLVVAPARTAAASPEKTSAPILHAGTDEHADVCRDLRAEQLAPVEAAFAPGPVATNDPLDEQTARTAMTRLGLSCWPTKRGAWAIQIEWVSPRPWSGYDGLRARFALLHVGSDGRRASVRPGADASGKSDKDPTNLYFSALDASGIESPTLFDFDGDGEEEIVLSVAGAYHEGESWTEAQVWRASGDDLTAYAPATGLRFERAKDVDFDGRPDLIGFGVYQAVLDGCCSGFGHSVLGPTLVFHSLRDGSFSESDTVASDAARFLCPRAPNPVIAKGTPWDESTILEAVACARLWGRSAKEIDADLAAATPPGPDTCEHATCADRSEIATVAHKWAIAPAPLTLR